VPGTKASYDALKDPTILVRTEELVFASSPSWTATFEPQHLASTSARNAHE
jgi:hypothetical protein